jgi:hypothetical protein
VLLVVVVIVVVALERLVIYDDTGWLEVLVTHHHGRVALPAEAGGLQHDTPLRLDESVQSRALDVVQFPGQVHTAAARVVRLLDGAVARVDAGVCHWLTVQEKWRRW